MSGLYFILIVTIRWEGNALPRVLHFVNSTLLSERLRARPRVRGVIGRAKKDDSREQRVDRLSRSRGRGTFGSARLRAPLSLVYRNFCRRNRYTWSIARRRNISFAEFSGL